MQNLSPPNTIKLSAFVITEAPTPQRLNDSEDQFIHLAVKHGEFSPILLLKVTADDALDSFNEQFKQGDIVDIEGQVYATSEQGQAMIEAWRVSQTFD